MLMKSLLARWERGQAELEAAFDDAERRHALALEREGVIALEGAAMAREDHAEVLFLSRRLQGLPLPMVLSRGITKGLDERGYGLLGTSAAVDETAAAHEAVLELVVRQVELELTLHILVSEIRRLNVRVNALRHRIIPNLETREATIEFHLAEREREERLRQRFFKRRRRSNGRRGRRRR